MANIERVKKAIAVMTRVRDRGDKLNMASWQYASNGIHVHEQDAHECGTAACFAGWLAVSPEFQADGGHSRPSNGAPVFEDAVGLEAIAEYLKVPLFISVRLCASAAIREFYKVTNIYEITPEMVISKLQELIN